MLRRITLVFIVAVFCVGAALAQTPDVSMKPSVITGDVVSVSDAKIVVNSKTGPVDAMITDKTEFKRVPPDNPVLKAAVASALSEIGVGDKLMVTGVLAADGKSLPARSVYLMTQSEINQKKAKETAEWRTRGMAGKVANVNSQTNQIIVEVGGMMGKTSVTLTPKANAQFLRYAVGSVKFADAKESSLSDVKVGDQIRALGDRSGDGAAFAAEKILTGSFRQVSGTVKSVDVQKNEVVIKDTVSNKDMTVAFGNAVSLKRFPPEMAERMVGFQMAGAARPPGQAQPPVTAQPAPQGTQPAPAGGQPQGPGRGMAGGPRGGNMDDMFDRLPNITAADLKIGDVIAILTSGSQVAPTETIKAIKLVAGVEPFIRIAQAAGQSGRGPGGGNQPGLNIPGLDGIGFP